MILVKGSHWQEQYKTGDDMYKTEYRIEYVKDDEICRTGLMNKKNALEIKEWMEKSDEYSNVVLCAEEY